MEGFRKMDEMEMSINLNAIRIAWIYSNVFLFVWVIYEWIKMHLFNSIPFILMSSQMVIYWSVQLYLKWKLGKDEK